MKYIVILGDGMADRPVKELAGKTPLQAASVPNMDRLAREGTIGKVRTVPPGFHPGSDIANLSILGYDPREFYTGRAPLEAASIGISLKGEDVAYELAISLEEAASGAEKRISFRKNGKIEEVSVRIPRGIPSGKKLRLAGKGMEGRNGGPPGDLYLQVSIKEHPIFTREGDDLVVEEEINFSGAVTGTTIEVPTLEGTKKVKVPPGTQSHTKLRLKGLGIPHFQREGRGDEYVKVIVKIPKRVSEKGRGLIQELAKEGI